MISKAQQEIIATMAKKVLVNAAPAAGKTFIIVERIKYLLELGVNPQEIVAITFTNNAAEELLERLNHPQNLFVGTIHSYINYLLLSNNIDTFESIGTANYDELFELIAAHPECAKPIKHLLVDEAQDSPKSHFEIFFNILKPENWFIVGDHRQTIYSFNHADANFFLQLSKMEGVTNYSLRENFRNDTNILAFARAITHLSGSAYDDNSIAMSTLPGKVVEAKYGPIKMAHYIKESNDFKNWFVLARTNEQLKGFSHYLDVEQVPYCTFRQSELTNTELAQKMNEDCVKLLTIHSAKGLEANNVLVLGAKFYNFEEQRLAYVAATRARHLLIWMKSPNINSMKQKITNWEK